MLKLIKKKMFAILRGIEDPFTSIGGEVSSSGNFLGEQNVEDLVESRITDVTNTCP